MKLSLRLIAEKLSCTTDNDVFRDIFNTLRLSRPVFYTGERRLPENTLCLCPGSELSKKLPPEKDSFGNGCAVISVGSPGITLLNKIPAVLVLRENTDILKVSNEINRIFDTYDSWEKELESRMKEGGKKAVLGMLKCSEPVFGTVPLLLTSADVSQNREKYERLVKEKDIFYYRDPASGKRMLCRNIFTDERFLCGILLPESKTPFSETVPLLLDYLASHVEKLLVKPTAQPAESSSFSSLLSDTVFLGRLNKAAFDACLTKSGWALTDEYAAVSITQNGRPAREDSLADNSQSAAALSKLKSDFGNFEFFAVGKSAGMLINLDRTSDPAAFFEKFTVFLSENGFIAGVSNSFRDAHEIRKYYTQASMAPDICLQNREKTKEGGSEKAPARGGEKAKSRGGENSPSQNCRNGGPLFRFSDAALPYIFGMASSEFGPEAIASPVYTRLRDFDAKNNTEYLNTLKVYLLNNMNAVHTAEALFVHRATIIYRIKRICEIGQTDLSDPDELLLLLITFRMTEE